MRFPSLSSWIRGRKVVDRGQGVAPPFRPVPVPTVGEQREAVIAEMHALLQERFGISHCPNCGLKVSVLVKGTCRDCQPEDAA